MESTNRLEAHIQVEVLILADLQGYVGANMGRIHVVEWRECYLLRGSGKERVEDAVGRDRAAGCLLFT